MNMSAAARERAAASETICKFDSTIGVQLIARSSQLLELRLGMPEAEPALGRIAVFTGECARRQNGEPFGVPSAQYDVVSLQRILQLGDNVINGLDPLLFSHTLQGSNSDVLLETAPMLVGQVGQFHGFEDTVHNERGAQAGAQAEKQHAAAAVAAKCLHGGIVDDPDRTAESFLEIESDPAAAEVGRVAQWLSVHNRAGIANGNDRISPFRSRLAHDLDHLLGS